MAQIKLRKTDVFNSVLIGLVIATGILQFFGFMNIDIPYLMVFAGGMLFMVLIHEFTPLPLRSCRLMVFLFLLMVLFSRKNVVLYGFFFIVFVFLSAWNIFRVHASRELTVYSFFVLVLIGLAYFLDSQFLLLISTVYFGYLVMASSFDSNHKWSYVIVILISFASVLSVSGGSVDSQMYYSVFSLPVSYMIYFFVVKGDILLSRWFYCIKPKVLNSIVGVLMSLISFFLLIVNPEQSIGILVTTLSLLLILSRVFRASVNTRYDSSFRDVERTFDPWFALKWEETLGAPSGLLSWRDFSGVPLDIISNDGIEIAVGDDVVYSANFPEHTKMIYLIGDAVRLGVHKRRDYHAYNLWDWVAFDALLAYLNREVKRLKMVEGLRKKEELVPTIGQELKLRNEITYYLHDNILQNIIATKNIVSMLESEQEALQSLAVSTLGDLSNSIRSQIHEIYPSSLNDLPFERNISILIDELLGKHAFVPKIAVDYTVTDRFDQDSAYVFYRVLQELLNNTCKHAQAQAAWISMKPLEDSWELEYRDDGVPFYDDAEVKVKHLGISSLRQQVKALQGSMEIEADTKRCVVKLPRRSYENTLI